MKRVVIAAGGTGGHFYPGLVLAQTLRGRGWQPLLVIRRADPAAPTLEKEGLAYSEVDLTGLPRELSPRLLAFAWKLVGSASSAGRILRDFQPQAVVGMGGYLSFPCVLGAARRGIPRAVHESNAILGLANRLCSKLGAQVFWGLPVPGARNVTGTPIRPALWEAGAPGPARTAFGLEPGRRTLLVFGGSQGARGLNVHVPAALKSLGRGAAGGLQVLHLSGAKEEGAVRTAYEGAPFRCAVRGYLDGMAAAYAAADLVVCRSGASTLAELSAQRKPAVLVPFPSAAANHQELNARLLEKAGAARVLLEAELPGRLAGLLGDLLLSEGGPARLSAMAAAHESLGLPRPSQAPGKLADAVERLAQEKK